MSPVPHQRSLTTARPGGVAPIEIHTEHGVVGVNGDHTRMTSRPGRGVVRQAKRTAA